MKYLIFFLPSISIHVLHELRSICFSRKNFTLLFRRGKKIFSPYDAKSVEKRAWKMTWLGKIKKEKREVRRTWKNWKNYLRNPNHCCICPLLRVNSSGSRKEFWSNVFIILGDTEELDKELVLWLGKADKAQNKLIRMSAKRPQNMGVPRYSLEERSKLQAFMQNLQSKRVQNS